MRREQLVAACFCALLLAACDPAFESSGQVTNALGQPVAGAEVWVQCDPTDRSFRAVTDTSGHFVGRGIGWRPLSCALVAHAPGFVDVAMPLSAVCRKKPSHLDSACLEVSAGRLVMASAEAR
jgi:hypothetical protein